ncbi:EamA family transporter [Gramella sp. AN32]|uniref:EamA family transporter n=1 Tax=Christiangramia antarctica TaxID=2058158 RepID=A0ABW5X3S2_9FLAO|nr:EamA family transporter [Gramella sp. AN32]MCM4157901.1 hypothetical protein [Gramella sp. AN32]
MIYLLLSVLSSTFIFIVFRLFKRFKVDTLQAIIINYFIACLVGVLGGYFNINDISKIPSEDWFLGVLILGVLFIVVFNLAAITTQRGGMSVVAIATKMSVAIPVVFGIIYYHESTGIFKIIGVVLALIAVYLASIKSKSEVFKWNDLLFPTLVFLGSGIIDTTIKYLEYEFVGKDDVGLFSASIFASAALIGTFIIIVLAILGKLKFEFRNILGGIVLGVPNFYSIYFLILALRSDGMESSSIFTINNVAIVVLSTVLGIMLFKEKLSRKNQVGLLLALIGIFLVAKSI